MERKFRDIPDKLWEFIQPHLPVEKDKPYGGRPTVSWRRTIAGILYRLRTGCQWKAIPDEFGSGSTCHRKMQMLERSGAWKKLHRAVLKFYAIKKTEVKMGFN
jgi:transposase